MEAGKVFVGGIAWDTTEERLREYFQAFGEVREVVIMRDRSTGRTRGFGFVVFADASIAEQVIRERHVIDGRTVEAKRAVPRDDNQNFKRNNSSIPGSPGLARTKKIFVGGLASTVTEAEFKKYFEKFGTITDVVVMYDPNTQRPRGFGFISYDSEEAVDKVLVKNFHELNGKMVEVKRAVPRELSPQGPTRAQLNGYNHGLNGVTKSPISYTPGYTLKSVGDRGMTMDGQPNPVTLSQIGYSPYSPSYWIGMKRNAGFSSNNGSGGISHLGHGHRMINSGNANIYGSGTGYDMDYSKSNSLLNTTNQNMWGNVNLIDKTNSVNSNTKYFNLGNANVGVIGGFGNPERMQGSSPVAKIGFSSSLTSSIPNFFEGEKLFGTAAGNGGSKGGIVGTTSLHTAVKNIRDESFGRSIGSDSFYTEHAWRSSSPVFDDSSSFPYGLGTAAVTRPNTSIGYFNG